MTILGRRRSAPSAASQECTRGCCGEGVMIAEIAAPPAPISNSHPLTARERTIMAKTQQIPLAIDPTRVLYQSLADAYDFLNERLFAGRLPRCLITLRAHRQINSYFSSRRFNSLPVTWITDEIALNPMNFTQPLVTLESLGHEMCHLEQWHFGILSPHGHNVEWGEMMKAIGLMPSDTGLPGGEETGQECCSYIIPGGKFELAADELIKSGFTLPRCRSR
jgi:hypothetical protein